MQASRSACSVNACLCAALFAACARSCDIQNNGARQKPQSLIASGVMGVKPVHPLSVHLPTEYDGAASGSRFTWGRPTICGGVTTGSTGGWAITCCRIWMPRYAPVARCGAAAAPWCAPPLATVTVKRPQMQRLQRSQSFSCQDKLGAACDGTPHAASFTELPAVTRSQGHLAGADALRWTVAHAQPRQPENGKMLRLLLMPDETVDAGSLNPLHDRNMQLHDASAASHTHAPVSGAVTLQE